MSKKNKSKNVLDRKQQREYRVFKIDIQEASDWQTEVRAWMATSDGTDFVYEQVSLEQLKAIEKHVSKSIVKLEAAIAASATEQESK